MKKVIIIIMLLAAIPIWKCGLDRNITLYEWAWDHTLWGPDVTHVPEESYSNSIKGLL